MNVGSSWASSPHPSRPARQANVVVGPDVEVETRRAEPRDDVPIDALDIARVAVVTLLLGPLFLLESLVDAGLSWPSEMIEHGALVLSSMDELLRVLPTDDIREAVAF